MKRVIPVIIQVSFGIIFIGKISNWFLNYSDEVNKILDAVMFTIIGISYFVCGIIWKKKLTKIAFLLSGVYLIVMNYIGNFGYKSIIGIVCLLTPFLLLRFFEQNSENEDLEEI